MRSALLGVAQEDHDLHSATAAANRRIDAVLFLRASLGKTRAFSRLPLLCVCFPHPSS